LHNYTVSWDAGDGTKEHSFPMTAQELTDFLNNAPRDRVYEIKTYQEIEFTVRSIGAAAWGNPKQVDEFRDIIQSWNEHR
jgi:hypothetical protein